MVLWFAAGCQVPPSVEHSGHHDSVNKDSAGESQDSSPTDSAGSRWTGLVSVQVVDEDGNPVPEAYVLNGGQTASDWVMSDADGLAEIEVIEDGWSERYLLAGKKGWHSGGVELDDDAPPSDVLTITMEVLPDEDNPLYSFQAGGDENSPTTIECGHCHLSIAGAWAESDHRQAAVNPHTWDIYTGSANAVDATTCDTLGGWETEGQVIGEEGTETRCYVGGGVLSFLNDGCGGEEEPACDHPDQRPELTAFGGCGDCHTPATDEGTPGAIDFADATGVASEGVTCDFCHKVQEVTPGVRPGLDGAISLLRPSRESTIAGQAFDPITFGPFPDVINPIMNGSYNPQFRKAEWCSACHEYAQPALHPDESDAVDATLWPDGLPILETFSEYQVWSGDVEGVTCQSCHMPVLDEESSTYNLSEVDQAPSTTQGWERESGEVRLHSFIGVDDLDGPRFHLGLDVEGGEVEATIGVTNAFAGHAVPTGEPLKQIIVLVDAVDENGAAVSPSGGATIPGAGGFLAQGVVGVDVVVEGSVVAWDSDVLPFAATLLEIESLALRFVRPTGEWAEYEGPGVGPFSDGTLTGDGLGVSLATWVGESTVLSADDQGLTLDAVGPETVDGDVVYLVRDHHWAGAPGWLYAKTLADASGEPGVAHFRATSIESDNRIAPGAEGVSTYRFPLPSTQGAVTVTATLMRRSYAASVADLYGWDPDDTVGSTQTQTYAD